MRGREVGTAPNYTTAALVMGGVNLFWMLGVIWVWLGLPTVMVLGVLLNWLIGLIGGSDQR